MVFGVKVDRVFGGVFLDGKHYNFVIFDSGREFVKKRDGQKLHLVWKYHAWEKIGCNLTRFGAVVNNRARGE
jgi:hypothetical protein